LIEPVVNDWGLELVDASLRRGRPPWRLCVTLDTPQGDGRVPVDRCADVSREIGTQLDAADAIPQAYHLEVSSPGLDRVLAREKDFAAACGAEVNLSTRQPIDGRRHFRGRLVRFDGRLLHLEVDGSAFDIAFDDVAKANSIYSFTPDDFARQTKAR